MGVVRNFRTKYKGWYYFNLILILRIVYYFADFFIMTSKYGVEDLSKSVIIFGSICLRSATLLLFGNGLVALFEKTKLKTFKKNFPKWFWFNIILLISSTDLILSYVSYWVAANNYGYWDRVEMFENAIKETALNFAWGWPSFNIMIAPFALLARYFKKRKAESGAKEKI